MTNKLTVGLIFIPQNTSSIKLQKLRKDIGKEWKIASLSETDILLESKNQDVRIRKDGAVFYYVELRDKKIYLEEMNKIWGSAVKLMKYIDSDIKYENCIKMSFHGSNVTQIYNSNNSIIKEFIKRKIKNYSMKRVKDESSTLVSFYPTPEIISFK